MVLFGQMLINNGTAIWQLWEDSLKAPSYQVKDIGLFFLIHFYYCRELHRSHQLANILCWLFFFKSCMLEVDHHPICIRTIDLQWVTGGGGCVSDTHKKIMKLYKLSCQKSTSTVLCVWRHCSVFCYLFAGGIYRKASHPVTRSVGVNVSSHWSAALFETFSDQWKQTFAESLNQAVKKRGNDSLWWHVMFNKNVSRNKIVIIEKEKAF